LPAAHTQLGLVQPGRTLLSAGEGLLDRALCVIGAVVFSCVHLSSIIMETAHSR
jgi:hypothetical protein